MYPQGTTSRAGTGALRLTVYQPQKHHETLMSENITDVPEYESNAEDDGIIVKYTKQSNVSESGASPLEDRFGRSLWARTRLCFCTDEALTDCRFHSSKEKGWEQCPNLELARKNSKVKGRWLWARNPMYGKPPTEDEIKDWALKDVATAEKAAQAAEAL